MTDIGRRLPMNLDFLRPLFDCPGSWVSVYLDATWAGENADHAVALRGRGLRKPLTDQDADDAGLETVETASGTPLPARNVGGWSHRRYLQGVEESWKRNAGDVASAAVDPAETVDAEVMVVGGALRAVQAFAGWLSKRWQGRVVQTDAGSPPAGADGTAVDEVTIQEIADCADRHIRNAVGRLRAQQGGGTASSGLTDVVTRLQCGQVDAVLLVDDQFSTDTLWIALKDPTLVSVDDHLVREAGVQDPQKVRADAAVVRAIAGTGAHLVLVGPDDAARRDGIGAVLHYADASSAAKGIRP
jgi:hypothetical protein